MECSVIMSRLRCCRGVISGWTWCLTIADPARRSRLMISAGPRHPHSSFRAGSRHMSHIVPGTSSSGPC
eukprot:6074855-Pyramimonas_sp.AAC.1